MPKDVSDWKVTWVHPSGALRTSRVTLIEGYSTFDSIPRILSIPFMLDQNQVKIKKIESMDPW